MHQLEAMIALYKPDTLVLDPLVELHTCEENDMRKVLAYLRSLAVKYKIAVLLAHHTRKGSDTHPGELDTFRGASSVGGAIRSGHTVCHTSADEAESLHIPPDRRFNFLRVDGAKSNYAPLHRVEWFEKVSYLPDNGEETVALVPRKVPVDLITLELISLIERDIAVGSPDGPGPLNRTAPRNAVSTHSATAMASLPPRVWQPSSPCSEPAESPPSSSDRPQGPPCRSVVLPQARPKAPLRPKQRPRASGRRIRDG